MWAAPPGCAVRACAIKTVSPKGVTPQNTARALAAGLFQHRTYEAKASRWILTDPKDCSSPAV